ncbi:MAG TPA: GTP cyclohydrolase FolE2 [Candidatus Cloacimonadota bacterium]|nr:GTP cyclohydrolase FolE2 [Candidatus Cloacimonadota bacterium]
MTDLPDIQSQDDGRSVIIDKVGVKGVRYPVIVDDRANGVQNTIAELDIYVELDHRKRGTHMSRFLEVLNRFHHENIISQLDKFLEELKVCQKAKAAYVDMRFTYFMKKLAPVSKIASLMDYQCFFSASLKDEFRFWIGVIVPVTTLCPCSREISSQGAHNQRSLVTIRVRYTGFIWLEELIAIAEAAGSCPIYPLLKRSDEKYVTETAYANPKFVEDIVRDITQTLEADTRVAEFYVESNSFESIHNHNAYAMVYHGPHPEF